VSEDKTTETTAPVSAPTTPEPTPIEQATPPAATPAAAPPDDGETATPEERPAGRTLTKSTQELIDIAASIGLENMARSRKQDIIFSILKRHAKSGEDIYGDGVLEILQDGFGFLRSADSSYLAGPTTSTSRRARSAASTCAPATRSPARSVRRKTASATSRCSRSAKSTFNKPENSKSKILFENLTPLFPDERLTLERATAAPRT
jgi:transcription termination factor Rho